MKSKARKTWGKKHGRLFKKGRANVTGLKPARLAQRARAYT